MTVHKKLLEAIKARGQKQTSWGHGILTADRYVRTLSDCVGSEMCSRFAAAKDANFEDVLRKASETLVYSNEDMGLETESTAHLEAKGAVPQASLIGVDFKASDSEAGLELPKNTLVVFKHVLTSPRKDRDGDQLRTEGALPDPKMLLLWQHVHTLPIGKMLGILEHTEKRLVPVSAIIDMNALCHDAAVMVENDMARFSHGFRALEYEMFKDSSGFDIKKFEIMEESLVSIPSNVDANTEEILLGLIESGKLTSDMMKAAGARIREQRPKQFTGVNVDGKAIPEPAAPACQCGKGQGSPAPAEADAATPAEVPQAQVTKDAQVSTKYVGAGDLSGSWENIGLQLQRQGREFLAEAGVEDMDESYVWVMGTYSDAVVLAVECWYEDKRRCFRCDWVLEGSKAVLTGEPQPVEINVEPVAIAASEMEERMADHQKKNHKAGASLSKANKSLLTDVRSDVSEVQSKEPLSRGSKALLDRSVEKLDSLLELDTTDEASTQNMDAKSATALFLATATAEERKRMEDALAAMRNLDAKEHLTRQVRSAFAVVAN